MIIYKITNRINGKIYIGQTIQLLWKRWSRHREQSRTHNHLFARALKKYGYENFSLVTLGRYENMSDLNNAEIYYISYYNCITPNGYNIDVGGKNVIRNIETIKKVAAANRGKKWSEAVRATQRLARIGTSYNSKKTHCPKGHLYEGLNIKFKNNYRECRICHNARSLRALVLKRRLEMIAMNKAEEQ
jgi:group I intron endonuclease